MTESKTESTPAQRIDATAAALGLTMSTQFVPWSQSRKKGEKDFSLNWVVTLAKDGRNFLVTDYTAGYGHCPASKASTKMLGHSHSVMRMGYIKEECETGKASKNYDRSFGPKTAIPLELRDVLYSLVLDSDVLDAGGFESWAENFGYDSDSRSVEATYKACLEIALKMRGAIGDAGLTKLREACQDY